MAPLLLLLLLWGCGANLIVPDYSTTTYSFSQSTPTVKVWTTPQTRRIRDTSTTVPVAVRNILSVSCGRNELESFQLVIAPSNVGSVRVDVANFAGLPLTSWLEVANAGFSPTASLGQGDWFVTDLLTVVPSGGNVPLSSTRPTVLWFTVFVPGATCGKTTYMTDIILTPENSATQIVIPAHLYVYNFQLDMEPHLATQGMSQPKFTVTGAVYNVSQLDKMYEVYGQHRMSGRSQSWPAGLNYQVSWDQVNKKLIDVDNVTSNSAW